MSASPQAENQILTWVSGIWSKSRNFVGIVSKASYMIGTLSPLSLLSPLRPLSLLRSFSPLSLAHLI